MQHVSALGMEWFIKIRLDLLGQRKKNIGGGRKLESVEGPGLWKLSG